MRGKLELRKTARAYEWGFRLPVNRQVCVTLLLTAISSVILHTELGGLLLSVPLGLIFLLYLPGSSVLDLLMPWDKSKRDFLLWVFFSFVASMMVVFFLSFILILFTPIGVTKTIVIAALLTLIVLAQLFRLRRPRKWEFEIDRSEVKILFAILFFSVVFRLLQVYGKVIPQGDDPYVHAGVAQFILANGRFPDYMVDSVLYNWGSCLDWIRPWSYAPFFQAYMATVKAIIQMSWYDLMSFFVPSLSFIYILGYYLFIRETFHYKKLTLLSTFLLAMSPIHIFRTNIGIPEVFGLIFIVTTLYLVTLACRLREKVVALTTLTFACLFLAHVFSAYYTIVFLAALFAYNLLVKGNLEVNRYHVIPLFSGAMISLAWWVDRLQKFGWNDTLYGISVSSRIYPSVPSHLNVLGIGVLRWLTPLLTLVYIIGIFDVLIKRRKEYYPFTFLGIFLLIYANLGPIGQIVINPEPYRVALYISMVASPICALMALNLVKSENLQTLVQTSRWSKLIDKRSAIRKLRAVAVIILILSPVLQYGLAYELNRVSPNFFVAFEPLARVFWIENYDPREPYFNPISYPSWDHSTANAREKTFDEMTKVIEAHVPQNSKVFAFTFLPLEGRVNVDSLSKHTLEEIVNGTNLYDNFKKIGAQYVLINKLHTALEATINSRLASNPAHFQKIFQDDLGYVLFRIG